MDVAQIVAMLFASYPNAKHSDPTIVIYVKMLQEIPPEELQAIVMQCIAECKFVPTIAEIRERWIQLTTARDLVEPEEAWSEVKRAIIRHGHSGKPEWSDSLIGRAVEALGWRDLCVSENQIADRAHFLKIYRSFAERKADDLRLLSTSRNLIEKHQAKQLTEQSHAAD